MGAIRTRATSLLAPFRSRAISTATATDTAPSNAPLQSVMSAPPGLEKAQLEGSTPIDPSDSPSSKSRVSNNPTITSSDSSRPAVRVLPTWVRDPFEDEEDPSSQLLPRQPPSVQVAQHNTTPSSKQQGKSPTQGGRPGQSQSLESPFIKENVKEVKSRWSQFASATAYPLNYEDHGERVTNEWLEQNFGDYSQPWKAKELDLEAERSRKKRVALKNRFERMILRSPMTPLAIRAIVWAFSAIALGLGGAIYATFRQKDGDPSDTRTSDRYSSPLMAICIDAVALVYLVYITVDEYSSQPLGIRSPKAKLRLILCDLFFIVFDSANLSLAFESVTDSDGSCRGAVIDPPSCAKQKALASTLFIALLAWLITFTISILRLVERVTR